ncbi:MAG TPA: YihY/virulence factor BrkB family protein [Syntrophorhabdaceae bacterium]|nr:YihY/virulence factor BrkB family protein [Syntrophorhabdaceae bacterium]
MIKTIKHFAKNTIWEIDIDKLPVYRAYPILILRIIFLALFNFYKKNTMDHASVLTYYTILNIVPIIAVVFSIAKGFGIERFVEKQIMKIALNAKWQVEITQQIIRFSINLLEQAKGGIIAGIGIILLLWTVIAILGKIEFAFNKIWGIKKERTLSRKFIDYMAIFIIAPILFTISNSITILISTKLGPVMAFLGFKGITINFISILLKLLSYISFWLLLTAMYMIMPNTRIPFIPAITGAIISGTLLQLIQYVYINFQIGVTKYGAIYGSLAALPLFFIWIKTSWIIVLFGVEIAYATENRNVYTWKPHYLDVSVYTKKILLLSVFKLICKQFYEVKQPLTIKEISSILKVPIFIIKDIMQALISSKLVIKVSEDNKDSLFQPARPPEELTIEDVLFAFENAGIIYDTGKSEYLKETKELLDRFNISIKNLPENYNIKKII